MNNRLLNSVWVLAAGGALLLSACRPDYKVTQVEASRVAIDSTWDIRPDTAMTALIAPYKAQLDSTMHRVVGRASMPMKAERPESPLSNLVADVLRQAAKKATGSVADVGLVNIGGLRASLSKGEVTVEDVYEILPFENALCVLTLRGADLRHLFENIAARGGEGVSGVRLTISADGRLLDCSVGGLPVDEERTYTVATLDYLAEGNDGMTALTAATHRQCPPGATLRGLFMQYVEQCAAQGRPLEAHTEGRITVK